MNLVVADFPAYSEKYKYIRELLSDEKTFLYMDSSPVKSEKEFENWLKDNSGEIGCNPPISALWFIEEEGILAGFLHLKGFEKLHKRVELSVAIHEDFRGKGLVTQAFCRIIDELFKNTDMRLIMAGCRVKNTGSVKAMEKAGLKMTAQMREWVLDKDGRTPLDCRWYSITRKEWEKGE